MIEQCPCGSELEFSTCCGPLLSGEKEAETAESLMRSRYVAFTKANVEYLYQTHHSANRQKKEKKKLKRWAQNVQWIGLSVLNTTGGSADEEEGSVLFRATYIENDQYERIHENAYFEKENEKWVYVGGMDMDVVKQEEFFNS